MDPALTDLSTLSIVKELSLGAVSVLALAYITIRHNVDSRAQTSAFLDELRERENAMRELETEVRGSIARQLSRSTQHLERSTGIMDLVVRHLITKDKT